LRERAGEGGKMEEEKKKKKRGPKVAAMNTIEMQQ
jgi:hypothetical protein